MSVKRVDLADTLVRKVGLSRQDSLAILELFLELISEAIAQGHSVKLNGFGTFKVRENGERVGRNPRNGVEHIITARKSVVFRPSPVLRYRINSKLVRDKARPAKEQP